MGEEAHGKCYGKAISQRKASSLAHTRLLCHDGEQRAGTGKARVDTNKGDEGVGHGHQQRYSPAVARGLRVVKPLVKGFGPTAGVKKACTPPKQVLPRWQASRAALARRERVVVACMTTTKLQHKRTRLGRTSLGWGGPCGDVEDGERGKRKGRNECMASSIHGCLSTVL